MSAVSADIAKFVRALVSHWVAFLTGAAVSLGFLFWDASSEGASPFFVEDRLGPDACDSDAGGVPGLARRSATGGLW